MMRSAMRTVEKRCEMTIPMRPDINSLNRTNTSYFGTRVKRGSRLVENEKLRIAHVGAARAPPSAIPRPTDRRRLESASQHLAVRPPVRRGRQQRG